jgi:hypothetical protein
MKRVAMIGLVLAVVLVAQASAAGSAGTPKVLEFDTMAGVVGPYVGTATPIRGVNGGGLPWRIDEGSGELRTDGRLEIEVEGLVLVATGMNPVDQFKAIVSCQTIVGTAATTTNVSTGTFPASMSGDSKIEATVSLPDPCFAPIVFVTSPGGAWFAVTGL